MMVFLYGYTAALLGTRLFEDVTVEFRHMLRLWAFFPLVTKFS